MSKMPGEFSVTAHGLRQTRSNFWTPNEFAEHLKFSVYDAGEEIRGGSIDQLMAAVSLAFPGSRTRLR